MPIRHENSVIPVKAKIRQIEKFPRITGDSSGVFCQPGQLAIAIRPINLKKHLATENTEFTE